MNRVLAMVAVVALGCAQTRSGEVHRKAPAPPASMQDHPLVVACLTAAPACHDAGWRALRGEGALAGDFAAASFFATGCQGGHAPSCADLAALHAAGRGVARDDARACELGLSEACARLERSGPIMAAIPTAPLPRPIAPAPFVPGEADSLAYRHWAWTVYPEWHEALGLTRQALERVPPAPPAERALLGMLVAPRMPALQRCVPAAFVPGPGQDGKVQRTMAVATFTLGEDGRAGGLAVRVLPGHVMPGTAGAWWACAERELAGWILPVSSSGGRFWLTFPGLGAEIARDRTQADPLEPVLAAGGFTKPRERERGCVLESIQAPYGMRKVPEGPVVTQFAIGADGVPRYFAAVSEGARPELVEAVWRAVRSCAWVPGLGPDGRPATVWFIFPVRFSSG